MDGTLVTLVIIKAEGQRDYVVSAQHDLLLLAHLADLGLDPPEKEWRFHPRRLWRFDYAWPIHKVALEIEGGIWSNGRHVRGSGFVKDVEKYNEAAIRFWRVVKAPTEWIDTGEAAAYVGRAFEALPERYATPLLQASKGRGED